MGRGPTLHIVMMVELTALADDGLGAGCKRKGSRVTTERSARATGRKKFYELRRGRLLRQGRGRASRRSPLHVQVGK